MNRAGKLKEPMEKQSCLRNNSIRLRNGCYDVGVAQMVSEGIDDTRMDLSQLEENASTGRSVPSTPLQSSPQGM